MSRFSLDTVSFLESNVHLHSYPRYMLLCLEKRCCIHVLFSLAGLTHSATVSGCACFDSHFITDFCRASSFHRSFYISTLRQWCEQPSLLSRSWATIWHFLAVLTAVTKNRRPPRLPCGFSKSYTMAMPSTGAVSTPNKKPSL